MYDRVSQRLGWLGKSFSHSIPVVFGFLGLVIFLSFLLNFKFRLFGMKNAWTWYSLRAALNGNS